MFETYNYHNKKDANWRTLNITKMREELGKSVEEATKGWAVNGRQL